MDAPASLSQLDTNNSVKILLDENISPKVAQFLREHYIDAIHVRDRGMIGARDDVVLRYASSEDRIVATCNVYDFEKYAQRQGIHAGIILICLQCRDRQDQLEMIADAVIKIQKDGEDMINRVLYVKSDRSMYFEDIPQRQTD